MKTELIWNIQSWQGGIKMTNTDERSEQITNIIKFMTQIEGSYFPNVRNANQIDNKLSFFIKEIREEKIENNVVESRTYRCKVRIPHKDYYDLVSSVFIKMKSSREEGYNKQRRIYNLKIIDPHYAVGYKTYQPTPSDSYDITVKHFDQYGYMFRAGASTDTIEQLFIVYRKIPYATYGDVNVKLYNDSSTSYVDKYFGYDQIDIDSTYNEFPPDEWEIGDNFSTISGGLNEVLYSSIPASEYTLFGVADGINSGTNLTFSELLMSLRNISESEEFTTILPDQDYTFASYEDINKLPIINIEATMPDNYPSSIDIDFVKSDYSMQYWMEFEITVRWNL